MRKSSILIFLLIIYAFLFSNCAFSPASMTTSTTMYNSSSEVAIIGNIYESENSNYIKDICVLLFEDDKIAYTDFSDAQGKYILTRSVLTTSNYTIKALDVDGTNNNIYQPAEFSLFITNKPFYTNINIYLERATNG